MISKSLLMGTLAGLTLASSSSAADLFKRPPPAPFSPPPAFTWTGCYVGVHVGYAGGKLKWTDEPPDTAEALTNHNQRGAIGGAQLGCNYQFSSIVLGVQGDFSLSDVRGKARLNLGDEPNIFDTKADYFGTLTARGGFAIDRALLYVKGGFAFTRLNHEQLHIEAANTDTFSARSSRTGWTLGAGAEYALTNNWTAFAEYNYMRFKQRNITGPSVDDGILETEVFQSGTNVHAVKVGLNYKFW